MTCENNSVLDSPKEKGTMAKGVATDVRNNGTTAASTKATSNISGATATANDSSSGSNGSNVNLSSVHSQALASIQSQLQARSMQHQQQAFLTPLQLQQQLLLRQSGGVTPPRVDQQVPSTTASNTATNGGAAAATSAPIDNMNLGQPSGISSGNAGNAPGSTAAKAVDLANILAAARQLRVSQGTPATASGTTPSNNYTGSNNSAAAAAVTATLAAGTNGGNARQGDFAWELLQRLASHQVNQLLSKKANDPLGAQNGAPQQLNHALASQQTRQPSLGEPPSFNSNAAAKSDINVSSGVITCSPVSGTMTTEGNGNSAVSKVKAVPKEDGKKPGKSTRKHPPDTVILPCRARGMNVDHNFRTAHFVIRPTVGHGEDLVCSYEACRTSGVKFRYCTSCRIPVAKRTFHQRHSHGIPVVYGDNGNSNKAEEAGSFSTHQQSNVKKSATVKQKKSPTKNQIVSPPMKKRKQLFAFLKNDNENETADNDDMHNNNNNGRPVANVIVQVDQGKRISEESGGTTDASDTSAAFESTSRQQCWAALLGRRPDSSDGDRMTAWLDEVMAVSNPKNHCYLKMDGSSSTRSCSSSKGVSSYKREKRRRVDSSTKKRRSDGKRYISSSSMKRRRMLNRKDESKRKSLATARSEDVSTKDHM